MKQIIDRIYAVPGMSIGRIYIIEGGDGLTLIDASLSTQTAVRLEPQLKEKGYTLRDIRNILITHAHPDHIGGLAAFQKLANPHTAVHHRDAAVVRGQIPIPRPPSDSLGLVGRLMSATSPMPAPVPARVDRELVGGDRLDHILPGLEVIETHGHSYGHVSYWWPEKRLLFGGDVLMHMPWGLILPIAAFTPDMAEAKRSVRKIADMDVDIFCPGHGRPMIGGASPLLRAFAARHT